MSKLYIFRTFFPFQLSFGPIFNEISNKKHIFALTNKKIIPSSLCWAQIHYAMEQLNFNLFYISSLENQNPQAPMPITREKGHDSRYEVRWRELDERDELKTIGIEVLDLQEDGYMKFGAGPLTFLTVGYKKFDEPDDIYITSYLEKGGICRIEVKGILLKDEISVVIGTLRFLTINWKADTKLDIQSTTPLFNLMLKRAWLGDAEAMYQTYTMYSEGEVIEKNTAEAEYWHAKAAESGQADAMYEVSEMLHRDYKYADEIDLLAKATDAGNAKAQYTLACYCRDGFGDVQKNPAGATHLFECAAMQLHAPALNELSVEYAALDNEPMSVFTLALAAEQGLEEAVEKMKAVAEERKTLTKKIFSIFGGNKDNDMKPDAKTIMSQAEQGNDVAMFFLARAYEEGRWGMQKNPEEAAKWYEKAFMQNTKSQFFKTIYFNKALETGCLDAKMYDHQTKLLNHELDDPQATLQTYREASKQGNEDASVELSTMYYHGSDFFGVERNLDKALEYGRLAEKQGSPAGTTLLAWCQMKGYGMPKDEKKGFEVFQKELNKKEPMHLPYLYHNMALFYATGMGVEKDLGKAEEYFNDSVWHDLEAYESLKYCTPHSWFEHHSELIVTAKALAEKNNVNALYLLGKYYAEGILLPYNKEKALECLNRIQDSEFDIASLIEKAEALEYDAAEANHIEEVFMRAYEDDVDAIAEYAFYLIDGKGVAQDQLVGADLSLRAAKEGNVRAKSNVGVCYCNGVGLKQDKEKGYKWLEEAAEEGYLNALVNITNYYIQDGRKEDYVKWMHRWAEAGDPVGQFNLGQLYMRNDEVPEDKEKAKHWHKLSADQNYPDGQFVYGCDLLNEGKTQEALEWLEKAAQQNHLTALHDLNVIWFEGLYGLEKDEKKGLQYLMKGVNLGAVDAMCDLGERLLNGSGMKRDYKKGKEWIEKAASLGSERAKHVLSEYLDEDKNWYNRHMGQAYVEMRGVMADYMQRKGYDVSKLKWLNTGISQKWHTFHDAAFTYNGKPFSLIIRLRLPDGKFYTPQQKGEFFLNMCQSFHLAPCMVDINARYDKNGNIETLSDRDISIHEIGSDTPIDFNKSYNEWADYPIITSWENYRLAIDFTVNMLKEKGYKVLATNDIIGQNPQIVMDDAEGGRHYVFVRTPLCPGDIGHVFAPVKDAVEKADGKLWYVHISQIVPTEYNGNDAFPDHPKNTEKWKVTSDMYNLIPIEEVIAKNGYAERNNYWKE